MRTTMTQVRAILPARLRTARLATIARDAGLTRFFTSGDDSTTIRGVLRELYSVRGSVRRTQALQRRLMREARSRRAMAGARRRRDRVQEVAHALAPAVQEVTAARGQRLANRQARKRALVLLRRRQHSFRAAQQSVGAELGVRYFNTQKSRVYATGHSAQTTHFFDRPATETLGGPAQRETHFLD